MAFFGVEDKERLCHLMFGHLNYKILSMLSPLVYGFPKVEVSKEIYEGCALGKHAKEKFPHIEA